MKKEDILKNVDVLYMMWKNGSLGGENMPEDENPHLIRESLENYLYFTLPMSLNYQRNSYTLWEGANKTYNDPETCFVFNPQEVLNRSFEEVQDALVKYRVALQKNKQTEIWIRLCKTFVELYNGDIRKLFSSLDNDVDKIRNYIQKENKSKFPYLSGTKLCNYWLFVIWEYTDKEYINIEKLTVAPDTHVIKSTHKLGLITDEELTSANVQEIVIDRWNELLNGTKYRPIDIHTALWLWSRNGFKELDVSVLNDKEFKLKVKSSYEKNSYINKFRNRELLPFEANIFNQVCKKIPKDSTVLDLGCGNGYPYDYYFCSKGYSLVGVDFCEKHIKEAKEINTNAKYYVDDIENYKYEDKYNLIMMLFSLLHIPRDKHKKILEDVYNNLCVNGVLILTLRDEDVGTLKYKNDFCGEEMLWSYYDCDKYIKMLEEIGFKMLYKENQNKYGIDESHNWLILQK